jgi:poly(ADP-ribose) glycohydrolase ARH3
MRAVCAAIYAALAHPAFEPAVRFAVRLGGDTDTIAAMTGAISAARRGARSIPARWLTALEDRDRGRTHVEKLGTRLLANKQHEES